VTVVRLVAPCWKIIVVALIGLSLGLVIGRRPIRGQTLEMQVAVNQMAQGPRLHGRSRLRPTHPQFLDLPAHCFRAGNGQPVMLPASIVIGIAAVSREPTECRHPLQRG